MRKLLLLITCGLFLFSCLFISCNNSNILRPTPLSELKNEESEENEMYDSPAEADSFEVMRTQDPALGYVPAERFLNAIEYTENLKKGYSPNARFALLWNERGPIYDSVGANGNARGGGGFTAGRTRAILVDLLNDPTGNTVIAGGVCGGIWKCNNFLSSSPNWVHNSDFFDNMAISSICQDPSSPNTMYFSTGEPISSADAVNGAGLWKSTDGGNTWNRLPSTVNFIRTFKIQCDASGNIYLAAKTTTVPVVLSGGIYRSADKGATWTNITPAGLTSNRSVGGGLTNDATCTDIEISNTGRLHASFGYLGNIVNHRYTSSPATATSAAGWNSSIGIRKSTVGAERMELATSGDVVYALTVSTGDLIDSCYKSIDGGANWTLQNTTTYPQGLGSVQGWYAITLAINPSNSNEVMMGGLDAYRSTNSGQTITRATYWVAGIPYVHADHHFMQWSNVNGESRILIGCDGGFYLSRDGGVNWQDRNKNLAIKQFYSGDIHPTAGSNYLLAGAQDNGTHAISTPGLTYSREVYGGDGMLVRINQSRPLLQFTTNPNNNFRRSPDGGISWSSIASPGGGLFVNPWDYDDTKDAIWSCADAGRVFRFTNASGTGGATATGLFALSTLGTGGPSVAGGTASLPTCFKASPYTVDRMYIGGSFVSGSSGPSAVTKIARIDNGTTAPTQINVPISNTLPVGGLPRSFLNCINIGSNDNVMVAVFSNYGIDNIWVSYNAGGLWTAIDGNLPDMPVRWAMFAPGDDQRMMIATETGVFTTDLINGASTVWQTSPSFPTVRTDMLRLRTSDNTVVAATHGRGLFTAIFPTNNLPAIGFASGSTTVTEDNTGMVACRRYKDYAVNIGIVNPPTGNATATINVQAGNTATRGIDFDFTTNADFTNSSNQVTFASGDVAVVPVTVRIYDDAEVEPTETFTLGFTISGTSNAIAGSQSTHTFTIIDNDAAPVPVPVPFTSVSSSIFLGDASLGFGSGTGSTAPTPFESTKIKHRLQTLIKASELRAGGFTSSGNINSLTLTVYVKNSTKPFKGFTISLANTKNEGLNNDFAPEALTPVFSRDYTSVLGDNVFNFSQPFRWDGESNIVIQYCFDNTGGTADAAGDGVLGANNPLPGFRASTYSSPTANPADPPSTPGCSLTSWFVNSFRPNTTLTTSTLPSGNPVATAANTSQSEYLASNNDLYYYLGGQIIARVKNTSAQNYGCTQVLIDRAGTGSTQFWNYNPANYLMNKTFQIVPTTNSATGTYDVTFYYTKEEKEGWEAATGQSWNNIMLIKVPSRISNVTPLNAQPDGPGTVQIITPVRGTFGTGYTLTGTFANGFSGFGAGIPGRINTILTLSGAVDNSGAGQDINLTWTTSAEVASTVFELEKSYDGVNFFKLTTVTAAGNKLSPSTYTFTDKEGVQINYYRVRLLHSDGTAAIVSNTIFIKNENVRQRLIVLNNPFSTQLTVRLAALPAGPVKFSFYDMNGRLVKTYDAAGGLNSYTINTNTIVSKGIYRMRVYIDNVVYFGTFLKQ